MLAVFPPYFCGGHKNNFRLKFRSFFNPLSANFTESSNTLKQFVGKLPTNCLSLFDHFVGLELKGLKHVYNKGAFLQFTRSRCNRNFRISLILGLIFNYIFMAICCWKVFHNLSQKWRDNIALLRMLHETRQILKDICCSVFDKLLVKQNVHRLPRYYFLREKTVSFTL